MYSSCSKIAYSAMFKRHNYLKVRLVPGVGLAVVTVDENYNYAMKNGRVCITYLKLSSHMPI